MCFFYPSACGEAHKEGKALPPKGTPYVWSLESGRHHGIQGIQGISYAWQLQCHKVF
jgi:hypothetical protein